MLDDYTPPPVSATNIAGLTDGASNSTQSYNHPGGVGDRSSSITVTSSVGLFGSGNASGLVNGNIYDISQYFNAGLNASSHWIKFDFGTPRKITEAKWFQSGATSHGSWKWQGSNDDSSYTNVGTSFTLGATTPQTHTSLNGNTVAYRYWKLVGVSGTTSSSPYINECEFKLNDSSAVSATSLSVPGQASFTGTAQFSSLPVLPRQTASTFLGAPASGSDVPAFRYVTRADIGSLSLTPSDMPTSPYLEAQLSSQTLLAATGFPGAALTCGTPVTNTAGFTYSSGVWTATIAGWYEISAYINKYPYGGAFMVAFKKNGSTYDAGDYITGPGSLMSGKGSTLMYLGVGDTFAACGFVSGDVALDVTNLYTAYVRAIWRGR